MPAELKQVPVEEVVETPPKADDAMPEYEYKAKITVIPPAKPDKLNKEIRFKIEYYSDIQELTFSGVFTHKRSDLGSYGQQKVLEAQLNGGTIPGGGAALLHMMAAYCQIHLVEAPDWWKPLGFQKEDFKLIEDVYSYTTRWEDSFRRKSVGKEQ